MVYDPITYLNIAKNSFRIEEAKFLFSFTYDFIYNYRMTVSANYEMNYIDDIIIKASNYYIQLKNKYAFNEKS